MRLAGEGEGGRRGGPSGDLYVIIHVEPHEFFQRDGRTIYLQYPVAMVRAALGCDLDVPTVDGSATLNIPAGTQSGQRFTLRGKGVADLRGYGRGDMVVEVQVQTPTDLTKKQKELLCEFDDLRCEEEEGFFSRLLHGHLGKQKSKETVQD